MKEKLRLYEDELLPLYKLYSLETILSRTLNKKVWLKSGGYLVIEQTEALTAVDVNSGKMVKKKDSFLKTNLEAAEELVRQIGLRNLSGMIIVDLGWWNLPGKRTVRPYGNCLQTAERKKYKVKKWKKEIRKIIFIRSFIKNYINGMKNIYGRSEQ